MKNDEVVTAQGLDSLRQLVDGASFKRCRDCMFCHPVSRLNLPLGWGKKRWAFATCHHPALITIGVVTGSPQAPFCSEERHDYETITTCGEEAKYFTDSKEPMNRSTALLLSIVMVGKNYE